MKYSTASRQRGVALIVSLIILVTLTLLGLTAIQRTTTDLTMAGNQRETGLMFQAAEVGLASAENSIETSTSNADFDDGVAANLAAGRFTVDAEDPTYNSPDYFDGLTWLNSSTTAATSLGTKEQPRFLVEYLGDRQQNALAAINIGGYGTQQTGDIVSIYRATSRGIGLAGNAVRYVQSYYGKDAP